MTTQRKQRVGIWGFGIVGKSALRLFSTRALELSVYDSRTLFEQELALVTNAQALLFTQDRLTEFLEYNDHILISPGVDLRSYGHYRHKWLPELDLLQQEFHKPIVAITGSVGKTSVTHLVSQILTNSGLRVWTGGNIGTSMLDLISTTDTVDVAILEVSSFQLEYCTQFAPSVALWTNLTENHLDRHGTMENYFLAKKNIFARQTAGQHAFVPLALWPQLAKENNHTTVHFFTDITRVTPEEKTVPFYFIKNKNVMRHNGVQEPELVAPPVQQLFTNLCTLTYKENSILIALAADLITQLFSTQLNPALHGTVLPPHRLEYVDTVNEISFYNDSKSTAPAPTIAAVEKLNNKPILLFLGGFKKGVDRTPLIAAIKDKVKIIHAFGAERDDIVHKATKLCIPCTSSATLEEAFATCVSNAQPGDQVLLSPAGSSFDLFKNYEERGNRFKALVHNLKK
jgi:UDP-N-acetylmuramoylalanine--D-glutamate ligase